MINSKINYIDIYGKDSQGLVENQEERKFPFQRLPQRYEKSLRKEVWDLSENSAGVSISFRTNFSELSVKWTIKSDFSMNHMTVLGIKRVDLYYKKMLDGATYHVAYHLVNVIRHPFFKGSQSKQENIAYIFHYMNRIPAYR